MALISRFSRLFRADLHAVLDRIEEPAVLLRQAVREMEEDVQQDERHLKILEHELIQYPALVEEVELSLKDIQLEISLCLDSENEELARSVIKRKLEHKQRQKRLLQKSESIKNEIAELQKRLDSNRNRLTAMQQKLEILEEDQSTQSIQTAASQTDFVISEQDIEVALLREKQARSQS